VLAVGLHFAQAVQQNHGLARFKVWENNRPTSFLSVIVTFSFTQSSPPQNFSWPYLVNRFKDLSHLFLRLRFLRCRLVCTLAGFERFLREPLFD
jgi:hypothetical protein